MSRGVSYEALADNHILTCNGPAQIHLGHCSTSPSRASTGLGHNRLLQHAASDQHSTSESSCGVL